MGLETGAEGVEGESERGAGELLGATAIREGCHHSTDDEGRGEKSSQHVGLDGGQRVDK